MSFQTILGGFAVPTNTDSVGAFSFVNALLDAPTERYATICMAAKTGTIAKVGGLTRTVNTGTTLDIRVETVDLATGDPSGTLLGTNSNGAQVVADGDDDTWFTTTLTTGVAVTKGDIFAIVVVNSGTGDLNLARVKGPGGTFIFTYDSLFTASWAKSSNIGVFSLEYSDGSYAAPLLGSGPIPISAISATSFNNTSSPDERALKFKFPFAVRVSGAWASMDVDGATDLVLYDSDGSTALQTFSMDKDLRRATSSLTQVATFPGTSELLADTFYWLSVKPTTGTSIKARTFDVDAAAIMDSFDGGQNFHYSERTDAGAWSDTTTKRLVAGIIIDGIDDATGAAAAAARGPIVSPIASPIV